jgi:hypothetical protein
MLLAEEEDDEDEIQAFAELDEIEEEADMETVTNVARARFEYVSAVTPAWQHFCQSFIDRHNLEHERTWSRRGLLNKLESELRNNNEMAREQLTEVKKYIDFKLHEDLVQE